MKKIILSIIMFLSCLAIEDKAMPAPVRAVSPITIVKFNPDNAIVDTLVAHGYTQRHANFWVRVARMESNKYNSILYTYHNNMWGMSYLPKNKAKRPTNSSYRVYHKNKPTRFAGYQTKELAIQEILFYLEAANYPKDFRDLDAFIRFMKAKGYFEEPFDYYKNALKNV